MDMNIGLSEIIIIIIISTLLLVIPIFIGVVTYLLFHRIRALENRIGRLEAGQDASSDRADSNGTAERYQ
jgi:hypothetical protein